MRFSPRFAFLILGLLPIPEAAAAPRIVRVAVVVDGPWERNADVVAAFEREIVDLTRGDFDVRFPESKTFVGDWTLPPIHEAIDGALGDPEVDLVLALGVLAAHDACHRTSLAKPVVAAGVIDPTTQGLPLENGASGVKNLAYVTVPSAYERDLSAFLEVARFRHVAILLNRHILESIPTLTDRFREDAAALGLEGSPVPVGSSAAEALAAIPSGADAVYLMPLFQLGEAATDSLIAGINARGFPSFSAIGEREVRRGVFAAVTPDIFPKMARRLAVTIHRILLGENAGTLPTTFSVGERLYLNAATMRAIDAAPSWAALTEAEIVGDEAPAAGQRLTLQSAVEEALAASRDLAASERAVAAGAQEVRRARSTLLPRAEIEASGVLIDEDRAAASFGGQAERTINGGATLSQVLFSEPASANLSIQKHLQRARTQELAADRLDVGRAAATAVLDVLRASTAERVRKENLRLTRQHLEMARTRESVGASGRSDVLRWESELATNRKAAIDANANRNLAEMELNRILHRPIEDPIVLDEAADSSSALEVLGRTIPFWENKRTFRLVRQFLAKEAVDASPEIAQLDATIAAASRRESSAGRALWLPSLGLQGSLDREFVESGAGTDPPAGFGALGVDSADETDWNVGVRAELPLFEGGEKLAEKAQAREERRRLEEEKRAAEERIEQRVRAALHRAGASRAGIREARAAATAAQENLDLVADAYSRGAVSLLDLLDAQNEYVVAGEAADQAVYDFLSDAIDVQRALGRFDFQTTPEEKQAFQRRLEAFLEAAENSRE